MVNSFWQWLRQHSSSNWFGLAVLTVATTIILTPSLFFHSTFFTNLDNVDQFYSWYQKLAISVNQGELPLWNPNTFGGQSFTGEIQQGVFYPLNLFWVWLFGSVEGIAQRPLDYLVALHFLLAAFGVYLVLKFMNLRTLASLCGGLVYAFSGVVAVRAASQTGIFFGLALLPYPLYFMLKYHESKRSLWLVFTGLILGTAVLSGHVQPLFHAVLILLLFELSRLLAVSKISLSKLKSPVWSIAKRYALVFGVMAVVTLPQLWLTYQYFPNAYRVQAGGYQSPNVPLDYGHFAKTFSVEPHEAANFINPEKYPAQDGNNLYIGLFPISLIIVALVLYRNELRRSAAWKVHGKFITLLLIVGTLSIIGYWTWFAVILYELPFVRQVRQLGRYTILVHMALVMVLALCIHLLNKVRLTNKQRWVLVSIGGFILVNSIYLFLLRKHIFTTHFALANFVTGLGLIALALIRIPQLRTFVIAGVIFLSIIVNAVWFYPRAYPGVRVASDYSLKPDLVELLDSTDGSYRVETENNALPVNIANAYDFQMTGGYGATIYAPFFEFSHVSDLTADFRRDLLGVVYIIDNKPGDSGVVYQDDEAKIYVEKRQTALSKLFVSSVDGSKNRADYSSLPVKTDKYEDSYQKYQVTMTEADEVIISEIQYPGWHLKIDGQPAEWKPYTIDGIQVFRSFWLQAGEHTVEFTYKPFGIF